MGHSFDLFIALVAFWIISLYLTINRNESRIEPKYYMKISIYILLSYVLYAYLFYEYSLIADILGKKDNRLTHFSARKRKDKNK